MYGPRVKLFSKTYLPLLHEVPANTPSPSHQMLLQSGYLRQISPGVFTLLPLGQKVIDRISHVIDSEMDKIGFEKVTLPCLQPSALWRESGRLDLMGEEAIRVRDRKDVVHVLSPTAEEVVVESIRHDVQARQLPVKLYQMGMKWRDEARARGGALRGREFLMKDGYSFHATEKCAEETYGHVCQAYERVMETLLPEGMWRKARGASGAIGGSLSHEWVVINAEGEDTVVTCHKCNQHFNQEMGTCPCGTPLPPATKGETCIEVGHTFFLGTRYSEPMKLAFNGKPVQMGCYGLGVSRLIPVILSAWKGIWPDVVAPYSYVVVPAPHHSPSLLQKALQTAVKLSPPHANVLLWDDSNTRVSHPQRVARAKLLRAPHVLQVSDSAVFLEDGMTKWSAMI